MDSAPRFALVAAERFGFSSGSLTAAVRRPDLLSRGVGKHGLIAAARRATPRRATPRHAAPGSTQPRPAYNARQLASCRRQRLLITALSCWFARSTKCLSPITRGLGAAFEDAAVPTATAAAAAQGTKRFSDCLKIRIAYDDNYQLHTMSVSTSFFKILH